MELALTNLDLTPEQANQLEDAMRSTRMRFMMKRKTMFWSAFLSQMQVVLTNPDIPVAATNGAKLWYNPYYALELSRGQLLGLTLHEVMHVVYRHVDFEKLKEAGIDLRIHNIAGDHRINNDIKLWGFELPSGGVCDPKYRDPTEWSTMRIYEDLLEQQEMGGDPEPQGFVMDCLAMEDDPDNADGKSKEATEELREALNQKLLHAVQIADRCDQAGSVPAGVRRHLEAYLNPKLPWNQILQHHVDPYAKDDYSMQRPNRRYHHMYLPQMRSEQLKQITVGFDVSGSMSDDDLAQAGGEVQHFWENLNPKALRVMTFDTELHDNDVLQPGEDFTQIKLVGGGGTDITPFIESIREEQPELAICFTDGYFYMPDMTDLHTDLIWIINNNPDFATPYGTVIHID